MIKFKSFLADRIEAFIYYRKASMNWNTTYEKNLYYFDNYVNQNYSNEIELTQKMINTWCTKRETEINQSCNTRIYIVIQFIRYLRERYKVDVIEPEQLKSDNRKYIPHAFSNLELNNFFYSCDTFCPYAKTKRQHIGKLTIPVFFNERI